MTSSYTKGAEFQAAEEQFNAMIEALLSEAMSTSEHGLAGAFEQKPTVMNFPLLQIPSFDYTSSMK